MERIADRPGRNGSNGLRIQALDWIRNEFEQDPTKRTAVARPADRHEAPTRIVDAVRMKERPSSQLKKFSARLAAARQYLVDPECNTVLGIVSVNWASMKYAGLLMQLRSNQLEADQPLARRGRSMHHQAEKE
jgi:hypothetical protein